MRPLNRLKMAWRSLTDSRTRDIELDEELQAHLEHETAMRVARGESQAHARREALLALGRPTAVAEAARATHSFAFLTTIGQDLRFALRLLRKNPVFSLAAVVSLALGIGANVAIFSVFERVLLERLPVERPEELYQIGFRDKKDKATVNRTSHPYPFLQEARQKMAAWAQVTCLTDSSVTLRRNGFSRVVSGQMVCGNFFSMLGVKPRAGRLFTDSDALKPGGHPVVVLAHDFWRTDFGSDRRVVGQTIELNRQPFEIVGVAEEGFQSPNPQAGAKLWIPAVMDGALTNGPSDAAERKSYWLHGVLRLSPRRNVASAEAELSAFASAYAEQDIVVRLQPADRGTSYARRAAQYERPFQMLLAVVGAVLLIACINVANLLLARAAARQREISTRLVLGASRQRLVQQFLTESLILAIVGGAAGLFLACGFERYLTFEAFGKGALESLGGGIAPKMVWWTLGLSIATGLAFGLIPALQADRQGSSHRLWGRKMLVSVEVALSVLLLVAAGLFLRTLDNLRSVDSGFVRENLITMSLPATQAGKKPNETYAYFREIEQRVAALVGVKSVALNAMPVMGGGEWSSGVKINGQSSVKHEDAPYRNAVSPSFFSTLGARIVEGREFRAEDNLVNAAQVAVVNESFRRRYFGQESALGRKIGLVAPPGEPEPQIEIVGVVKDLRDARLTKTGNSYWYVPYVQRRHLPSMTMTVRTEMDPRALMPIVRKELARFDPYLPVGEESTMAALVEKQISQERLVARLSAFFALAAVVLAIVGLYGVMSFTVERRTKEIGIRLSLGETPRAVLRRVVSEAGLYLGLGAAVGLAAAYGLAHFVEKMLYGVKPVDPVSLVGALSLILVTGLAAAYVAARKAARIDPMVALRSE